MRLNCRMNGKPFVAEQKSKIYGDIYKDGVLLYEIEEFDDEGNCQIRYCR